MKELLKVQSDLKAPKNQRNNFGKYNYRSCEDILEAVKPLLKENNLTLSISDEVKEVGGFVFVEATATVTNEKANEVTVKAQAGINPNRKGMDIAQSYGSSSSYARKYALNGLFLIDDNKEVDEIKTEVKKPVITDERLEDALAAIGAGKYTLEKLKTEYNLTKKQLEKC